MSPAVDPVQRALRADGRRNREGIVAAAEELFASDGAQASLEAIARRAGVGSATLHRHFPTRSALLEAVFRDGVAELCARAEAQSGKDAGDELAAWLEELTVYTATHRGLATALLAARGAAAESICCTDMVSRALERLVTRAAAARALAEGVRTADLLHLANAIGVATEGDPDGAARLLRLALAGVRRA